MTNSIVFKLVKIADQLDSRGQEKLADMVDSAVRVLTTKQAGEMDELIKKMETEPFDPTPHLDQSKFGKCPACGGEVESFEDGSCECQVCGWGEPPETTKDELDAFMGEEETHE